jgi:hypothetical protein
MAWQEVVNEVFEIALCANKNVAVVEDLSFRDQKITELAPTMLLHKGGVQVWMVNGWGSS